jgi:hypothetical protein
VVPSVRQCEYATDILFADRAALGEVYPHLWQHAMRHFSTQDVMRFLGKKMTRAFSGESVSDIKLPCSRRNWTIPLGRLV